MRINVLIPSRGRVRQLASALTSLQMMESMEHEVSYCVACDEDDPDTFDFLKKTAGEMARINIRHGPRPESLGSIANDLSDHWRADVYMVFGDDLMCTVYGWDAVIAKAVEQLPYGVFWMKSNRVDPALVPIVTERWRAAAGGIFTEYFPFWYDDLWLYELWIMATDMDPQFIDVWFVDKPQKTHRMRELKFWNDFYHSQIGERIAKGREIASKLGLPAPVIGPHLAERLKPLALIDPEYLKWIESVNQAETTPPTEAYLRAKARAEDLMRKAA